MPEFLAIGAVSKRVRNILRQADEKNVQVTSKFEYLANEADEAKLLATKLDAMMPRVDEGRKKGEYLNALLLLGTLREDVDRFFDKVMVMIEDDQLRANRLALLKDLLREFSTIADFSEIVTEGK
jgi:glycyl-tRNA synthetase beta chain